MTTCYLAPDPIQSTQFIPGGNTPANGGQLFFYASGSSTKQTVYKDNAAAVAWTNPIVLDSGGNLPSGGEVWFPTGQTFKVIFAPSTDTDPPASPYWTKDNLSGMNDVSATVTEWASGPAPTFISATQFVLQGDQSATFDAGRRLKTTNTAGTVYSTITKVSFSSSSTTVNVVNDSGSLDSGLSAVFYGLVDGASPSISPEMVNRKSAAVASAGNGTTNIWGTVGDYSHITGTNDIHHFSTAPYAGAMRDLVFDGVLTLFSSATISLPWGNVTTAANDVARVRADTVSTYTFMAYTPASGTPIAAPQTSGFVFAGPTTGTASASPAFRALTGKDGASFVHITTIPVSAATSAVNITGLTNVFDEYEIQVLGVSPTSNNANFQLNFQNSSSATFATSASYRAASLAIGHNNTTYSVGISGATGASIVLNSGNGNAVANGGPGVNCRCSLPNLATSTVVKAVNAVGAYDGNAAWTVFQTAAHCTANAVTSGPVSSVQFSFASGNISSGTFRVFGIRNS